MTDGVTKDTQRCQLASQRAEVLESDRLCPDGEEAPLFREVALPEGIKGRLYLHSMPGRNEELSTAWAELTRLRISTLVRLAPMDEIRKKSPQYAKALEEDAVPCTVLSCPVCDFQGPDDDAAFVARALDVAESLRSGDSVLVHCGAGKGRTGMFAIAALIALGLTEKEARKRVADAKSAPEEPAQDEALRRIGPRLKS